MFVVCMSYSETALLKLTGPKFPIEGFCFLWKVLKSVTAISDGRYLTLQKRRETFDVKLILKSIVCSPSFCQSPSRWRERGCTDTEKEETKGFVFLNANSNHSRTPNVALSTELTAFIDSLNCGKEFIIT